MIFFSITLISLAREVAEQRKGEKPRQEGEPAKRRETSFRP